MPLTYLYPGVSLSGQIFVSKQGRKYPLPHLPPHCVFCGRFMREYKLEAKQEGKIVFRHPPFKTFVCDWNALNHIFIRELAVQVFVDTVEITHRFESEYGDLCEACNHLVTSECHQT